MDLFSVIEFVVLFGLLGAFIAYAVKRMKQQKVEMGAGYGTPIEPRELTEEEQKLYKECQFEIYGKLYASSCALAQNYGSDQKTLNRQAAVAIISGGSGIYGYPCKVEVSGEEYTLPRRMVYYLQDGRLPKGTSCVAIWEWVQEKWHLRLVIPENYLNNPVR